MTPPMTKSCRKKSQFQPFVSKATIPHFLLLCPDPHDPWGLSALLPALQIPTAPRMFDPRDPDHLQQLRPFPPPQAQELQVIAEIWSWSHQLCCTSLHSLSFISLCKSWVYSFLYIIQWSGGLKNAPIKFISGSVSVQSCQTCWCISAAFTVLH